MLNNRAKIVIFGHTHERTMRGMMHTGLNEDDDAVEFRDSHIYANTGAWISTVKNCSFVETEYDADAKKHYVKVKDYNFNGNHNLSIYRSGYVAL
jgi:hypothetical protein